MMAHGMGLIYDSIQGGSRWTSYCTCGWTGPWNFNKNEVVARWLDHRDYVEGLGNP